MRDCPSGPYSGYGLRSADTRRIRVPSYNRQHFRCNPPSCGDPRRTVRPIDCAGLHDRYRGQAAHDHAGQNSDIRRATRRLRAAFTLLAAWLCLSSSRAISRMPSAACLSPTAWASRRAFVRYKSAPQHGGAIDFNALMGVCKATRQASGQFVSGRAE